MKIVAICGSPRIGNTHRVLDTIKDNFPVIDFKLLMLKELHFELCKGCYSCDMKGEEKCPIKDNMDMILSEMAEADGVIFSSPIYSHIVSALLKNFYVRFGYLSHRPQFFDKYAMSLTTEAGYGAKYAIQYMDKMAKVFGFEVVTSLDLNIRPGKQSDETVQNNNKIIEAFKVFISRIEKGERTKPTMNFLVPFHIFKLVYELDSKSFIANYEYYKDKNEYFYDTKISPLKTLIAKKIARKEILK